MVKRALVYAITGLLLVQFGAEALDQLGATAKIIFDRLLFLKVVLFRFREIMIVTTGCVAGNTVLVHTRVDVVAGLSIELFELKRVQMRKLIDLLLIVQLCICLFSCSVEVGKDQPILPATPGFKWIPYETKNKPVQQELWDASNNALGNLPLSDQLINRCELLLQKDQVLKEEKRDVAFVYSICANAAYYTNRHELCAKYLLRSIETENLAQYQGRNLQIAIDYISLSRSYLKSNQIQKSIDAAQVVIDNYPEERLVKYSSAIPKIVRYDPKTKQTSSMPDTTLAGKSFGPVQSFLLASGAIEQLSRVFQVSNRINEGLRYLRQLRQQHLNSEIALTAVIEEGNLQLQKNNFVELKSLKQQVLLEITKYPASKYRVEQVLRDWERTEKIKKETKQ
jgi:hypothetical protein